MSVTYEIFEGDKEEPIFACENSFAVSLMLQNLVELSKEKDNPFYKKKFVLRRNAIP